MSDHIPSLADLRRDIDVLDDQILDLLRRRSDAVLRVADAKDREALASSFLRPGREAQILRRLAGRTRGSLPIVALIRIWRELISSLYRYQAQVRVAVHAPNKSAARWDLARDFYGSTTPLQLCTTASAVFRALSQPATLGIMAMPEEGEKECWWPLLASRSPDTPRIVGRLPFVPNPRGRFAELGAYVIANMPPEDSGEDNTLIVLQMSEASPSMARLSSLLGQVGLAGQAVAQYRRNDEGARVLLELPGFVAEGDPRLAALVAADATQILDAVVIGAYAVPLPPETD
ncbi:MAG: chorismate mutase [Ferrovibrio sp.]|uniref:chorismate mutase n=1 Tax=Ferrovibrio sp. TaxID=1917215 RepID=UPI00263395AC|nr:chorismate mutase [Ferrovibrio sp.]MCW0236046.1 chorismate mutase [Ferrovibrio sp.]